MDFLFKVIIGRVLVGAISIVLTTALISFRQNPDDAHHSGGLSEINRMLENAAQKETDEAWNPSANRQILHEKENGFVLIAHGLNDYVGKNGNAEGTPEEWHWMPRMQHEIEQKFEKGKRPEIVLVDWEESASPNDEAIAKTDTADIISSTLSTAIPKEQSDFLLKVATIRTHGTEVGEMVGYKLARAIRKGQIDLEKPMHFIGHSAGGFVVVHAAIVLKELGLEPQNLRITILDTPLPLHENLKTVAESFQVDFYQTSKFTSLEIPDDNFHSNYERFEVKLPEGSEIDPFLGAHSYAHRWFIESIINDHKDGFQRSPLFDMK